MVKLTFPFFSMTKPTKNTCLHTNRLFRNFGLFFSPNIAFANTFVINYSMIKNGKEYLYGMSHRALS